MARSVEDVLARRTRALFLDAGAALAAAVHVAALLAEELGRDAIWQADQVKQFNEVAQIYRYDANCSVAGGSI
jgi:glycerol-3-phosphate dehydrogenase